MSYFYFLLRPRTDIATSITVTRFVPNSIGRQIWLSSFNIAVYTLLRDESSWLLHDVLGFRDSQHLEISSDALKLDVGEVAVAVPIPPSLTPPKRTQMLPEPENRTIDGSPVATRCSLRFHWSGASSSYQSEYPLSMSERVTGSVSSFNLSATAQGSDTSVIFCAVNITRDATHSSRDYSILPIDTDGIPLESASVVARRNFCSTIETSSSEAARRLAYVTSDAVFLPIYVTMSRSGNRPEIGVEHTHPPHEMFWRHPAQSFCLPKLREAWARR